MSNILLFDGPAWDSMYPLTLTRPLGECQVGMFTIKNKWSNYIPGNYSYLANDYLAGVFPAAWSKNNILINGAVLPNLELVGAIFSLTTKEILMDGDEIIAFKWDQGPFLLDQLTKNVSILKPIQITSSRLVYPEDILNFCDQEFRKDFVIATKDRTSAIPSKTVNQRGEDIFIEDGAKAFDCILNATEGPIYISHGAEIMENAVIKGPVYIGPNATVHVGSKIYAHTMLGPYSKVGGEIKRSTIFGYSNKAHDGYLGDSVIGQWCNMGADTNNSNMKNTYGTVSLWDKSKNEYRITDRQFLGLIMGDHTMCAINTAFNTGSMAGVFANIFGSPPERWSKSFTWGNNKTTYDYSRAVEVAERAMGRKSINPTEAYKNMLKDIFENR